jgi:hypothetical protein
MHYAILLSVLLPACLFDSGDFALIGELTEANSAYTVFSEITVGSSADFASVVSPYREFRSSLLFYLH